MDLETGRATLPSASTASRLSRVARAAGACSAGRAAGGGGGASRGAAALHSGADDAPAAGGARRGRSARRGRRGERTGSLHRAGRSGFSGLRRGRLRSAASDRPHRRLSAGLSGRSGSDRALWCAPHPPQCSGCSSRAPSAWSSSMSAESLSLPCSAGTLVRRSASALFPSSLVTF